MAEEGNFFLGVGSVILSSIFFGVYFLPVRRFSMGDGFFVQFMMSIGVFIVGFVVYIFEGFPTFYPLAMLGGFFYALGNSVAVALINELGLAIALLIWNTAVGISGWAVSRFGLFGLIPAPPKSDLLNYIGLVFVMIGCVIYMFVKSTSAEVQMAANSVAPIDSLSITNAVVPTNEVLGEDIEKGIHFSQKKSVLLRKAIALVTALIAGTLIGQTCTPVVYIQDHPEIFENAPRRSLAYVFPHFAGVALTTSVIFLAYTICKRNKPWIRAELALPAASTGAIWAIAMALMFVSNEHLSQAIALPMTATLPGCVASLLSVFYFNEIKGRKDLLILSVAFTQTVLGAALIAASKEISL